MKEIFDFVKDVLMDRAAIIPVLAAFVNDLLSVVEKSAKYLKKRRCPAYMKVIVAGCIGIIFAIVIIQGIHYTPGNPAEATDIMKGSDAGQNETDTNYDFTVDKKVRLAGDTDKTWKETVEAKVGDKVEFQIHYQNTSSAWQNNVSIRDILPPNLRYIEGSTKLMNASHPNGDPIEEDYLVGDGLKVGAYSPKANAYILFTAEVVDDSLAYGSNTLINWAQVRVGDTIIQNSAIVIVEASE